jgi:hypothetical protein
MMVFSFVSNISVRYQKYGRSQNDTNRDRFLVEFDQRQYAPSFFL